MLFTDLQFLIILILTLFSFFFHQGYTQAKRSAGFFLLFAGFLLMSLFFLIADIVGVMVSALMAPFAVFIMILGIMKTFYTKE